MFNQGCATQMAPNDPAPPAITESSSDNPNLVRITNNLGTFEYDRSLAINFPVGIVGFPDVHEFGLANLPNMPQFNLLQCLAEPRLSFIVLPTDPDTAPIDAEDLKEAADSLGIQKPDLIVMFVITIRTLAPGQGITMSINHRAPILVDSVRRIARQFVLSNNKYSVQHVIG
ncbi:MAG: flagellar assembly protein FliW [Alphaproteobacteria bacterium]|nr:MAG: flagellar assembly protein FliW [Alphaproteobacteria bacterium]